MSAQIMNVSVPLYSGGTIAVGTAYALAFKAPSDSVGGGISVISAGVSSKAAIAAGSAPLFELVTLNASSVVNGTIGTVAAGAYGAGTVKEMTIVSAFVDAPYYVAFKDMATAVNGASTFINGYVQYQMGK